MKFDRRQGTETQRDKRKHLRELDALRRQNASRAVKKAKIARAIGVSESKHHCRALKKTLAAKAKRDAVEGCVEHALRHVGPLDKAFREAVQERDSVRASQRAVSSRAKEQAKRGPSARERYAEERQQAEADVRHHMGSEWAIVFRTWQPPKRKADDTRSLFEQFSEYAHDTPEALEVVREKQHVVIKDADLNCAQAKVEAERGNWDAELWHGENCEGDKSKRRPKGSAASRTSSLYASGERPDQAIVRLAKARKPRRGPAPIPGQATFGVGKHNVAAFIDSDARQMLIGG